MPDPFKEFEEAADKKMQEHGFMLFKRTFAPNKDAMTLTYCKKNEEGHAHIMVTGLEVLETTSPNALGTVRAESAIIKYNAKLT